MVCNITSLCAAWGDLGVFVAMFLESSIVPIPSEAIVIAAGAIGLPLVSIVIFGSCGAVLGSCVGYALGRYAAMPLIFKFGKFILIKPHHIEKAEAFAKKYGSWSVLIGRILPIVPFKVFSIASGIVRIPFIPFILFTFIGVVPRIFILAIFGTAVAKYHRPALFTLGIIILVFVGIKVTRLIYSNHRANKVKARGGV